MSTRFKKLYIFLILFLVLFSIISFKLPKQAQSKVILDGKTFSVQIANTDILRQMGLSLRDSLKEDEGMLFVFQKLDKYGFWMKDMKFPIDILWIGSDFRVIHIEKSLSPSTYPKVFYSETPAVYVLEVSAGQSDQIGVKIGDNVQFIDI